MKKQIFLITLLAIITLVPSTLACSCIQGIDIEQEINKADVIFTGKMTRFTSPDSQTKEYEFEVNQVWKGGKAETLKVRSNPSDAACGYTFKLNDYYLVYAYNEEDGLRTNICSPTKLLSQASEDIRLLKGDVPLNESTLPENKDTTTETDTTIEEDKGPGFFQSIWDSFKSFFSRIFGEK